MGKKWEKIKPEEVKVGDEVRIVDKRPGLRTVTESVVTELEAETGAFYIAEIETWNFPDEFDKGGTKLYRKVKPFDWPNKLGAVVSGKDEGETLYLVLVMVDEDEDDPYPEWYHPNWGAVNKADLHHLKNLKVLSEGVDTE